jgi:hypothetical protein
MAADPQTVPFADPVGASEVEIFSRGRGSSAWTDTHLTYMINVLTTEFTLAGGAR